MLARFNSKSHSGRDVGLISVKKYKSFIKINFSWFHTLVKPNHQHDAQVLGGIQRILLANITLRNSK